MNDLKSKLIEFGLSDKEANVYLAMLELGPSSVQDIAKKAGVNRATTYVMLESLKRRGLMSSVERGKKLVFAAESPEHLLHLVKDEIRDVEDKRERLEDAMPNFMGLFNAIEDKPKVRYFEGEEGAGACRDVIHELSKGGHPWRQFIHIDKALNEVHGKYETERAKLGSGKYHVRVLYSIDEGLKPNPAGTNFELRRIPVGIIPSFNGEFDIFDTFIVVVTNKTRPIAVIIESEDVAKLFQSFFDLAWKAAEV